MMFLSRFTLIILFVFSFYFNCKAQSNIPDAGLQQQLCSDATLLAGNTPIDFVGVWTLISGSGNIIDSSNPITLVSGLSLGTNVFRWTFFDGVNEIAFDEVEINVDEQPTISDAGQN